MARPLIIVGASTRAAAVSGIRAGYEPWCIDLFADRDLRDIATCVKCPASEYPEGLIKRIEAHAPKGDVPVLCTGAMENHAGVVDVIAGGRSLMTSSGEAMRSVREPLVLPELPPHEGIGRVRTLATHTGVRRAFRILLAKWSKSRWVIKPCDGAGGRGIRFANMTDHVPEGWYMQEYIEGDPISACFVTDGWSVKLLGATRQLIGVQHFHAKPFAYCGSIGPLELNEPQRAALTHLGVVLAQRFDLRGVFGIDLIRDAEGVFWPVEVNPRYTASIEVIEQSTGVDALSDWPIDMRPALIADSERIVGKAYLFAERDVVVPDLLATFSSEQIADVPDVDAPVREARPICTVFARAGDDMTCLEQLHDIARRVYTRVDERTDAHPADAAPAPTDQ